MENNLKIALNILSSNNNLAILVRLNKEIDALKKEFKETDYKTTKNIQYEKMGKEPPYNWDSICNQAESIRLQIREKEKQIENLSALR